MRQRKTYRRKKRNVLVPDNVPKDVMILPKESEGNMIPGMRQLLERIHL
jgi:hypothetical protein